MLLIAVCARDASRSRYSEAKAKWLKWMAFFSQITAIFAAAKEKGLRSAIRNGMLSHPEKS